MSRRSYEMGAATWDVYQGYEEFRITLSQAGGQPAGNWSIRLDKAPDGPASQLLGVTESVPPSCTADHLNELRRTFAAGNGIDERRLRVIGSAVWRSVFVGQLLAALKLSRNEVQKKHRGLAITVVLDDDGTPPPNGQIHLSELPVELMRYPEEDDEFPEYPGDSVCYTISRILPSTGAAKPVRDQPRAPESQHIIRPPLRILVVIADPKDIQNADAVDEFASIRAALTGVAFGNDGKPIPDTKLQVVPGPSTYWGMLKTLSVEGPWHVLHFIGHGAYQKAGADPSSRAHLYFEDEQRNAVLKSATDLANDLQFSSLKLVLMTACQSSAPTPARPRDATEVPFYAFDGVAHAIMRQTFVSSVVAMQFDFTAKAAKAFSETFYTRLLSDQYGIDSVVTAARRSMAGQLGVGSGFWGIPTVYWKSHGGRLFDLENLSDAQQKELDSLETRIAILSRTIVDLNTALVDVKTQVDLPQAARDRFDALEKPWNDLIAEARERKSTILGDAVSLSSTQGKPEGQVEVRMLLRLRNDTKFNAVEFRVAFPRKTLTYNTKSNGPTRDTSLSVDPEDDPADPTKQIFRVVFTNIGLADWKGGMSYDLGALKFFIPAASPPNLVNLEVRASKLIGPEPGVKLANVEGSVNILSDYRVISGKAVRVTDNYQVVAQGDIAVPTTVAEVRAGLLPDVGRLAPMWPGGQIPYVTDPGFSAPQVAMIKEAMNVYHENTPVRFIRRENQENYVLIRPGAGCSSSVGMHGGKQDLILEEGCHVPEIIHELGHTVGYYHENCRPDRDDFIEVHPENIAPNFWFNFDLVKNQSILGRYDLDSIMHLPPLTFSINGKPTMTARDGRKEFGVRTGISGGVQTTLSKLDIEKTKLLYRKD